jgi:RNA polymerase sigma factor (sigma-70 family)
MTLREEIIANYDRLQSIAMVLTRFNEEDANDLVQDGVERMLKNEARFTPGTSMLNWAFIIMRNSYLKQIARSSTRSKVIKGLVMEIELNKEVKPTRREREEELELMTEFIEKMQELYRVPLQLCIEGYSAKDIAERLNTTTKKVKNRLFEARQRVRRYAASIKKGSGHEEM